LRVAIDTDARVQVARLKDEVKAAGEAEKFELALQLRKQLEVAEKELKV
jgi:hypothetical protein